MIVDMLLFVGKAVFNCSFALNCIVLVKKSNNNNNYNPKAIKIQCNFSWLFITVYKICIRFFIIKNQEKHFEIQFLIVFCSLNDVKKYYFLCIIILSELIYRKYYLRI